MPRARARSAPVLGLLGGLGLLTTLLAAPGTAAEVPQNAPGPAPAPVASVDFTDRRQEVEGFGGASDYFTRYLAELPEEDQEEVLDALFDSRKGAGFTIMRNELWGGGCDGDETVRCPEDREGIKPVPLSHSIEPGEFELYCPETPDPSGRCEPGELRDRFQVWFNHEAKERQPELTGWLHNSDTPEYMKDEPYELSRLSDDQYQAYADYLVRSVKAYREELGVPVQSLSPANEPPFGYADKVRWTYEELNRFVSEYFLPTLEREGMDLDLMLSEDVNWFDIQDPMYNDPVTMAGLDIHAAHAYSGGWQRNPLLNCQTGQAPPRAVAAGKRIWQSECTLGPSTTEQAVRNARRIHEFFTAAQGNAWIWWRYVTGSDDSTLPDGRAGLVTVNDKTGAVDIKKSVWTTAQFSRFVRPGWERVETTSEPTPGVFVSAFADPDTGKKTIVVVNENTHEVPLELDTAGMKSRLLSGFRTSEDEDTARILPEFADREGRVATTLKGMSVTTYTGRR